MLKGQHNQITVLDSTLKTRNTFIFDQWVLKEMLNEKVTETNGTEVQSDIRTSYFHDNILEEQIYLMY